MVLIFSNKASPRHAACRETQSWIFSCKFTEMHWHIRSSFRFDRRSRISLWEKNVKSVAIGTFLFSVRTTVDYNRRLSITIVSRDAWIKTCRPLRTYLLARSVPKRLKRDASRLSLLNKEIIVKKITLKIWNLDSGSTRDSRRSTLGGPNVYQIHSIAIVIYVFLNTFDANCALLSSLGFSGVYAANDSAIILTRSLPYAPPAIHNAPYALEALSHWHLIKYNSGPVTVHGTQ